MKFSRLLDSIIVNGTLYRLATPDEIGRNDFQGCVCQLCALNTECSVTKGTLCRVLASEVNEFFIASCVISRPPFENVARIEDCYEPKSYGVIFENKRANETFER